MRRSLIAAAACCIISMIGLPAEAGTISGDFIVGQWADPILSGCIIDGVTRTTNIGALSLCFDNSSGAVSTITNAATNAGPLAQSTITSGANPGFSSVRFTGGSIPATHGSVPFAIGGISFTNGASAANTSIFGATLNLYASNGFATVFIGSVVVDLTGTVNDGTLAQNADFLNFSGLAGVSLEAFEGATVDASLIGEVIGDPFTILTSIALDGDQSLNGFIGTDTAPSIPEPSTLALVGAGLAGLVAFRRRRKTTGGGGNSGSIIPIDTPAPALSTNAVFQPN